MRTVADADRIAAFRSPFIAQEGPLTFRHFDLVAQALSKLERGHT